MVAQGWQVVPFIFPGWELAVMKHQRIVRSSRSSGRDYCQVTPVMLNGTVALMWGHRTVWDGTLYSSYTSILGDI